VRGRRVGCEYGSTSRVLVSSLEVLTERGKAAAAAATLPHAIQSQPANPALGRAAQAAAAAATTAVVAPPNANQAAAAIAAAAAAAAIAAAAAAADETIAPSDRTLRPRKKKRSKHFPLSLPVFDSAYFVLSCGAGGCDQKARCFHRRRRQRRRWLLLLGWH